MHIPTFSKQPRVVQDATLRTLAEYTPRRTRWVGPTSCSFWELGELRNSWTHIKRILNRTWTVIQGNWEWRAGRTEVLWRSQQSSVNTLAGESCIGHQPGATVALPLEPQGARELHRVGIPRRGWGRGWGALCAGGGSRPSLPPPPGVTATSWLRLSPAAPTRPHPSGR